MRNLLPMVMLVLVGGVFSWWLFDDTATRMGSLVGSLVVFLGLQLGDMRDQINRLSRCLYERDMYYAHKMNGALKGQDNG